jgi:DNA-binding transcriptional MocR family regulator
MKLYESLAQQLQSRIEEGFYAAGDKLPSIRELHQAHGVSISTVQEAFRLLEADGWAEPRPKSGYYVLNRAKQRVQLPNISRPAQKPLEVAHWDEVLGLLCAQTNPDFTQLSRAVPYLNAPTLKPLTKLMSDINRHKPVSETLSYETLKGSTNLRLQIARIMVDSGCRLHPEDLVITNGCQEALSASLLAIAEPGDIIAVDSPSFYGSMQIMKALGLKALEIPTHPETGISLEALEMALEQWPIKALQITPTCNNPLGYTMPDSNKQALLNLTAAYDLPIIEDDIYGDLAYQVPRPPSIKSMDTEGRVLYCSSFSKTLAPGFRVGWVAPGRYLKQVMRMKYVVTASTSTVSQLGIAEFIAQGGYERHLRKMRAQYQAHRDQLIQMIQAYFPSDTRISYPTGGFVLWVQLNAKIDTVELNNRAADIQVSIAPGVLFSAKDKYKNCMRLNYTEPMDHTFEASIERLGDLIKTVYQEKSLPI